MISAFIPQALADSSAMLIVELTSPGDISVFGMSGSVSDTEDVISQIKESVNRNIEIENTYDVVMNGFSVSADISDIEKIKKIPGVKNVYVSHVYSTPEPMLNHSSEQMTITPQITDTLGLTGKGQLIAVIDNEFNLSHDFFKTDPAEPKLSKADITAAVASGILCDDIKTNDNVYKSKKIPFAYDYGCKKTTTDASLQSHGTHVAGIAAGSGGISYDNSVMTGIAPDAQLALMKVTTNSGTMYTNTIIQAIEDAIKLGADSVNISLGIDYSDGSDDTAFNNALTKAFESGVFVAVASGNSSRGYNDITPLAENTDYSASGTPAVFSSATSVASANCYQNYYSAYKLELPSKFKVLFYSTNRFAQTFLPSSSVQYYPYELCTFDENNELENSNIANKIALIKRGGNMDVYTMFAKLKNAGAIGVILWNTEETFVGMPSDVSLPYAVVTASGGELLNSSESKQIKVTIDYIEKNVSDSDIMSDFSSWGFNSSLDLKPEITAPGSLIYSSVNDGDYTMMQGTSMASPHIAGAAALISQHIDGSDYLKNLSTNKAALTENILMSSARVQFSGELPYSPRLQGAGIADITHAVSAETILTASGGKTKINLGDNLTAEIPISFDVKNISGEDITASVSYDIFTDAYNQVDGKNYVAGSKALSSSSDAPKSISLKANETKTISFTVSLSEEELSKNSTIFTSGFYIDGYVYLKSDDTSVGNIPFCGYFGDYDKIPYLDNTLYEGGSTLYDESNQTGGTYFFTSNGSVLGQNRFTKKYYADNIAISSVGSNNAFNMQIQPLRAGTLTIELKKADTVLSQASVTLSKFSDNQYGLLDAENIALLAEGKYTFSLYMDGKNAGAEHDDSKSFDLTVDNTKPTLSKAYYSADGKKLVIEASDNYYIQGITVGNKYSAPEGSVSCFKTEIDISDIDIRSEKIKIYDYAMNVLEVNVPEFPYTLRYINTSSSSEQNITTVFYNIIANADCSASAVVASYDGDNNMLSVSEVKPLNLTAGTSSQSFTLPENSKATVYKLFLWNGIDTMRPLSTIN